MQPTVSPFATVPGLDVESIAADHERSSGDRLVFVLADSGVCSECGGSGEYVGLNAVETCGGCGGSGREQLKGSSRYASD
jgi:hypothetical protein